MVTFQIAGESVLFAGSRCGLVKPEICRALIERFRRPGFGFFVGCADGVARLSPDAGQLGVPAR